MTIPVLPQLHCPERDCQVTGSKQGIKRHLKATHGWPNSRIIVTMDLDITKTQEWRHES
jgi:hypothetical protein